MDSLSFCTFTVVLLLLSYLMLSCVAEKRGENNCPSSFDCSPFGTLSYPFTMTSRPDCGVYAVNCTDATPTMGLPQYNLWFDVLHSSSNNNSFLLGDPLLLHSVSCSCEAFAADRVLQNPPPSLIVKVMWNQVLWRCPKRLMINNKSGDDYQYDNQSFRLVRYCGPEDEDGIYQSELLNETTLPNCSQVEYPRFLVVELSEKCSKCVTQGGRCQDRENGEFHCINRPGRKKLTLVGLGILGGILALLVLGLIFQKLRKIKVKLRSKPTTGQRSMSVGPGRTSKMYFSLPIFSYEELEQATNHFDSSMELGDGGFGTVYYGKLKDGREAAVKRFYERNYRRLEQFMNEIEILNCLRHQNLVSLYGCTSPRSKALLLVYEYLPNGTVADHLHGDRAKCGTLTWPVRMRIAIETAKALSYLHASDIIHRDVKTNNILLDNNFGVKVADFGLSRLFPTDVTHVSTVPQGTPGYLDPEYHQCYQLTGKSDVYSFGVVLLEVISSLPAVDVSRKDDEINLSSYAMKRIQCGALGELVDPRLGFESNAKVRRMTSLVAELAFRCLQHKKEFRPAMDEVLQDLISIENSVDYDQIIEVVEDEDKNNYKDEAKISQAEADYSYLLKVESENPPSPKSVIHKWSSIKTITPAPSL